MEWALAIPRGQALGWLAEPWGVKESGPDSLAEVREVCEGEFGPIKFSRMYFGQEFCEKSLPGAKELEQALILAGQQGMNFTLVTPYVTEGGLEAVKSLLRQLMRAQPQGEVVVNDWGVLQIMAEDFPTLTPVLGRLLNKLLRDPRMLTHRCKPEGEALARFRSCSLAGAPLRGLLHQYKVGSIELDFPPQGLADDLGDWGYETTLYLPYGVIMTGRICLLQSWGLREDRKFKALAGGCDRKCRHYWLEMSDPSRQVRKSRSWVILQKGNTIFYKQQKEFLKKALDRAAKIGIKRLVIQREPI